MPVSLSKVVVYLCLWWVLALPRAQPQPALVTLLQPQANSSLQALQPVQAQITLENFSRYELEFAYQPNPLQSWFPLASGDSLPEDGVLTIWDTSTISAGSYQLRLRVYAQGVTEPQQALVSDLLVGNVPPAAVTPTPATIVEAPTSEQQPTNLPETPTSAETASTASSDSLAPGASATLAPTAPTTAESAQGFPTFQHLFFFPLMRGALVALVAFCLLGVYPLLRRLVRPKWRFFWRQVLLRMRR